MKQAKLTQSSYDSFPIFSLKYWIIRFTCLLFPLNIGKFIIIHLKYQLKTLNQDDDEVQKLFNPLFELFAFFLHVGAVSKTKELSPNVDLSQVL